MADRNSTRGNRRGGDGRGQRGRVSSGVSRRDSRPCHYFIQHGTCRFGSSCKFLHEQTPGDNASALRAPSNAGEQKSEYKRWKRLLEIRPSPEVPGNLSTLAELWSGAVEVLNGESRESQQLMIQKLIDDANTNTYGCQYLYLTLKVRLDDSPHALGLIENFLRTITHTAILNSLSIDTYVGNLYNIVSGAGGERAVAFFSDFSHGLLTMSTEPHTTVDPTRLDGCLYLALEALYELLCREKRASFHEDLPELLDRLEKLFDALDAAFEPALKRVRVSQKDRLAVLRNIVKIHNGLIQESDVDPRKVFGGLAMPSVYPIDTQLPGERHDNDDMDITRIGVFPTSAEITSDQPDYLPSTDCRQPHFHKDPVRRYIDTQFRLLRYDVFGPLKSVLGPLMQAFHEGKPPSQLPSGDFNGHIHRNASIAHISIHEKRGFEIHVDFQLPHYLRRQSAEERGRWWASSKKLEPGSLSCLLCSVEGNVVPLLLLITEKGGDASRGQTNASKPYTGTVVVKLARRELEDLQLLIRIYIGRHRGILVSLTGLIPATFTPILRNLQRMIGNCELPFQRYIVPNPQTVAGTVADSIPPRYALHPNFSFSLNSIMSDAGGPMTLDPRASSDDPSSVLATLEHRSGLDAGQSRALVYALTREYALIQGPPGTGKSYLGLKLIQVLLDSQKDACLGPIIIICYTNHALDQFLQHLLSVGIRKIIRIGGQSRSPEVEGHNLRAVSQNAPRTKHEGYLLGKAYSDREEQRITAGKRLAALHQLRKGLTLAALKRFIQRRHPLIYSQLDNHDNNGFTAVGNNDPLERWLGSKTWVHKDAETQTASELLDADVLVARANQDIHSLLLSERRFLAEHWADILEREETAYLFADIMEFEDLYESVNSVHNEVNRRTLMTAEVIGVTTTGLARDIATLQKLRAKVVVCEEAAEVLEAHMVSALMPGVEHIIQIGDHQQLRPQINNYSLSLETPRGMPYQLDRSQFERLAVGEPGLPTMPVAQLNVQRRMRPQISLLIRNTMYPDLQDHTTVLDMPDVVGMRENVFWLDHDSMEDTARDDERLRSHSNEWEVEMTKALVRHIVRQGEYKSTDIAVLTPYTGQLQKLRSALTSDFEICLSDRDEETLAREDLLAEPSIEMQPQGRLQKKGLIESLRLATVDNFQGEEAKIVIVSLVRSNHEQKPGFLRTKNRINVLLSRAQHGLYLIGNADTYAGVPMWAHVQQQLEVADAMGRAFNLCCPRHKDTAIQCSEPEHFLRLSPEGGCLLPCDRRLDACGHKCQAKCHSEAMHAAFVCPQPCPRVRLTCRHPCPKLCGESCGPCHVLLDGVQLPCGHKKDRVRCSESQNPHEIRCLVEVDKTVPRCGHVVSVPCSRDVSSEGFRCPTPCRHVLACGHVCPGTCETCKGETHKACTKVCQRPSNTCNHICRRRCHVGEPCPPCDRQCDMRCAHSRCSLKCFESCAPCIERCAWTCEHQGRCSMPCAAPCDRLPCDERCAKTLACGHRCPGHCGEPCPEGYCQVCGSKADQRVDLLEFKVYKDIDLDETPIVVLSCEHFFTSESLDGLARLNDVYSRDPAGKFDGLLAPSALLPVPRCPDCQSPLRQSATQRYNRIVNAAVLDETSQRFFVKGQTALEDLEQRIDLAEKKLEDAVSDDKDEAPAPATPAWRLRAATSTSPSLSRYKDLRLLEREVAKFCRDMSTEQQPSKKLSDAVLEARARQPLDTRLQGSAVEVVPAAGADNRIALGGQFARLRTRAAITADKLRRVAKTDGEEQSKSALSPHKSATALLKECKAFIDDSAASNLPRLAVLGTLLYSRIAKYLQASHNNSRSRVVVVVDGAGPQTTAADDHHVATAKTLLAHAAKMCDCDSPFEGADRLRGDVEAAARLLGREWYEPVTEEEMAAVRAAMVGGPGGMATHSGHWYKCPNGHTFAIGECGMPMELARCPECGAGIGGTHHEMVAGVTRATDMEGK